MTATTYTNGTTPHTNGATSEIDALLLAIPTMSAETIPDWSLKKAPLLAFCTPTELERVKLALINAGVTKTFIKESLSKAIDSEKGTDGGATGEAKQTQAEKILELIRSRARFFTGDDGDLYASVSVAERQTISRDGAKATIPAHTECHRLKSNQINSYLSHLYNVETGKVAGSQARADAKTVMEFLCSERIEPVYVRVAGLEGKVYIDRGTPDWSAIEVDTNGWRIVATPPVNFRRSSAMAELPTPIQSDDISQLALFANVDSHQWPLVVAFIIACLYPRGPYPILVLTGEQGSAKSTTLRVIKRLVDPSAAEIRRQPDDLRDLMIAASNAWLLAYDNVSYLKDEVADTMCVISTGGGFSKKANYTDGDEYIINVMRPQAINGIGDFATRGDLLDRAIIITPPVIPENQREDEKSFWARFDVAKPALLGALLHCLSIGLRNMDATKLTEKPRMADFAKLAVAAEPGYNAGRGMTPFIDLYMENREENTASILETSPLARVLWDMIKKDKRWEGSSRKLFAAITAASSDTDRKTLGWPTGETRVKTAIMRIAPALRKAGIDAKNTRHTAGSQWEITYTPRPERTGSTPMTDTFDSSFLEEK